MYTNNLGYDPDLDSLYYDWADPLITWPSTPISWNTGYSSSSPLPTGSGSTGANLINETGEISFVSAQAGSFATCVKVESWRCGQKIGEIFRDIPISILSQTTPVGFCAPTYQSGPPLLSLTPDASMVTPTSLTAVTNLIGDTIAYETSAYPGDTIKFEVLASDPIQIQTVMLKLLHLVRLVVISVVLRIMEIQIIVYSTLLVLLLHQRIQELMQVRLAQHR